MAAGHFALGVGLGAGMGCCVLLLALGRKRVGKEAYVSLLGLIQHPEGGFFRETVRSGAEPMASKGKTDLAGDLMPTPGREGGQRNVMTSIYYMITADHPFQNWVNNTSDHVHYWHAGAELVYHLVSPEGFLSTHVLGPASPQLLVRGKTIKCAELSGGDFALIGEGVAPGFDFRDFHFVSASELRGLLTDGDQFKRMARFLKEPVDDDFDRYYEEKAS